MSLLDLIRGKSDTQGLATAIPATFATPPQEGAGTVARIATVAVANPQEEEPAPPPDTAQAWAEELREYYKERSAVLEHDGGLPRAEAEEHARRATGLLARNKGAPWAALREALNDPSLPDTDAPVDHPPYGLPEWCVAPDLKTVIRQGAFRLEKPAQQKTR